MDANMLSYLVLSLALFGVVQSLTQDEISQFQAREFINGNTGLQGTVTISDTGTGRLLLQSNGLPDHPTGAFDGTRQYPNLISAQSNQWTIPKNPQVASSTQCLPMGTIAMAINGVSIFNPFSIGCCDAGEAELNLFDVCWGHPAPGNIYHYHIAPKCLYETVCSQPSGIVGVAMDGFPIYGPIDEDGSELFTADLDECHGKEASDGSYRYHVTSDYPYYMTCYKGTVLPNAGITVTPECQCTVPVDPCTEFGGGPPPPKPLKQAIQSRNMKVIREMLGLKAEGGFTCCADSANCDYDYNETTGVPTI